MWRGRPRPRLWECITVLKECLANRKRLRRPNFFHGPINYRLQFFRILHFAAFGENFSRLLGRVPSGISHLFFRTNCLLYLQEKGFNHIFLHSRLAPENALRVNVNMKVARLDVPANAGFFPSFAFCCLAMRHSRMRVAFGKGPFASAIRIYQQEFQRRATPPIAHSRDLQWQSKLGTGCSHRERLLILMISRRYFRSVKVQPKRCRGGLPKSYYVRLVVARSQRTQSSVGSSQFSVRRLPVCAGGYASYSEPS